MCEVTRVSRLPVFDADRCSGTLCCLHEIEEYLGGLSLEQLPSARQKLLRLFRQLESSLLKEQIVLDELGRDIFGAEDGWMFGYILEMMRHVPVDSTLQR